MADADAQLEAYNYTTFWISMPTTSPAYAVGDDATVVSFTSLAAADNTVQTITLGGDDAAVAAVAATLGAFALTAAATL